MLGIFTNINFQNLSWSRVHQFMWTASSEFGTYHLCEQRRFRRACASAQSRQNLRCSLIQAVNQEEPSGRKTDPWPLWMAGHVQLKSVMMECSKTQIRLTGLMYFWPHHDKLWFCYMWSTKVQISHVSVQFNQCLCCLLPRQYQRTNSPVTPTWDISLSWSNFQAFFPSVTSKSDFSVKDKSHPRVTIWFQRTLF